MSKVTQEVAESGSEWRVGGCKAVLSAWIKPYLFPTLTVGYCCGTDISDFEVEHLQSLEQLLVCNGGSTHVVSPPAAAAKSLQLCPTLCDPIDGSPPGSPVPGILQARTLEWVAISFSNA